MTYNIFSQPQAQSLTLRTMISRSVLSAVSATALSLVMVGSASAMLPTPEPELDAPSNSQNAAVVQQASSIQTVDQNDNTVAAKVMAFLLAVDSNGQNTLVPITEDTQLKSGNVIEYQGHFTNIGKDRQRKMTVTMSIPTEVTLQDNIFPEFPLASMDGKAYGIKPLYGRIDGQIKEIPLYYYRNLRWDIEGLGVGETAVVKYQAVVN